MYLYSILYSIMIQKTAITETNKHKNMRFKLIYNHPFKVPKMHMEIIKGDYFMTLYGAYFVHCGTLMLKRGLPQTVESTELSKMS